MKSVLSAPGPRYQATLELLHAAETLWNSSRLFFDRWNLSPSQFNVLNLLWGLPDGLSQIDVSRKLIMHRSNVTGLIDRLERRDLVKRRATPGDRRAYRVVLTPAGNRLMAEILPYYYQAAEAVWAGLSITQVRQLAEAMAAVSANAARLGATYAQSGLVQA